MSIDLKLHARAFNFSCIFLLYRKTFVLIRYSYIFSFISPLRILPISSPYPSFLSLLRIFPSYLLSVPFLPISSQYLSFLSPLRTLPSYFLSVSFLPISSPYPSFQYRLSIFPFYLLSVSFLPIIFIYFTSFFLLINTNIEVNVSINNLTPLSSLLQILPPSPGKS